MEIQRRRTPEARKRHQAVTILLLLVLLGSGLGWYLWNRDRSALDAMSYTSSPGTQFTIATAGDIATANGQQQKTAKIISNIKPDYLLPLGDIQYPDGKLEEYMGNKGYDKSWGKFRSITRPVPGNHDYHQRCAAGYFTYFDPSSDGRFGKPCKGYYSFKDRKWLFLAVDSECAKLEDADNCKQEQEAWVSRTIDKNPGLCVAAYFHRPAFSHAGADHGHGDSPTMQDLFKILYANKASLVFVGHNHFYSRSHPLNGEAKVDETSGVTQFVVGTGGAGLYKGGAGQDDRNIEAAHIDRHGILKLDFVDNKYFFSFIDISGVVRDSGSATGHCEAT